MDIFGDRGEGAWTTEAISDKRFGDEDVISPEIAELLGSKKFIDGLRAYKNGKPVEPDVPDVATPTAEI